MSACEIKLVVHKPEGNRTVFVPLDFIEGKVIVKVNKEVTLENIQIKLSGDLHTYVSKYKRNSRGEERLVRRNEYHELLYDVDTLFPPDNIKAVSKSHEYTMIPGTYEYDFKLQIPLTAACGDPSSAALYSNRLNSKIEMKHSAHHSQRGFNSRYITHLAAPLPPSTQVQNMTHGYSVAYELKVTVRRRSLFKGNYRKILPLKLMPFDIYVPHNPSTWFITGENKIVKKQYTEVPKEKRSFLGSKTVKTSESVLPFQVKIDLFNPYAIINTNPIAGISILSKLPPSQFSNKDGSSNGLGQFFLKFLTVHLISNTRYSAEEFQTTEGLSHELLELAPISIPIDLANGKTIDALESYETAIPLESILNERLRIPAVVPSFASCSISTEYTLSFDLMFSHSKESHRFVSVKYSCEGILLNSGIPKPSTANININNTFAPPPSEPYVNINPPEKPSVALEPAAERARSEKEEVEAWFKNNKHLYDNNPGQSSDPAAQHLQSSDSQHSDEAISHQLSQLGIQESSANIEDELPSYQQATAENLPNRRIRS
ncbi:hypothetical protein WICMUC_001776 [Wickerhamomyces mucosus]|uniref:Arrestin-like N-terminal domain-containing protein n=1 Tax=Wickerhamomyces mucosus TaxID=1378264 RepID=A0A9P8TFZ1_9ASCO|nr:hypothetical protein WICMUC_001776 [Wickerhamomyces mucosus]